MAMNAAVAYAKDNADRFVEELKELLRIPSISTDPARAGDVRRAAQFVADELGRIGMQHVELIETAGHPLVYADWLLAPGKPTVLCYGHYDVQPAEPLDEWISPAFEPEIRNGNIYARGAVDDKGQFWMHVKALEAMFVAGGGALPVNVRVIIEGEEEVGGEGIAKFLREHGERLKADVAIVSDTDMFAPDLPTLCVGMRGMIYTELEVRGAKTDLHSGQFGGAAPNPFVGLSQIIAKLKDDDGRILVPGVYDRVLKPTDAELGAWQTLPFDEDDYREGLGTTALPGEPGYSVLERLWSRPTLEIHGMPGGFIGAGAKTVIPAKAVAKLSMRLVPDMTPVETFAQLDSYIQTNVPKGCTVELRLIHSGDPFVVDTANPFVGAATEAMRQVFQKETVFVRGGGSIPVIGDFIRVLETPTLVMGFGLPDDNLHAPNEKFNLSNFHRGIESLIRFFRPDRWSSCMPLPGISAFVLAGGKSSRMGTNKALLEFDGEPLIVRALRVLREVTPDVAIAGGVAELAAYAPFVADLYPEQGPLGGIVSALAQSGQEWNVFLAVDMPFVTAELLCSLLAKIPAGAQGVLGRVRGSYAAAVRGLRARGLAGASQ